MTKQPDEWPHYSLGSREHLHAVGVLVAAWNMVESTLQAFIQSVFPQAAASITVFEILGNDGRIKLIRNELRKTLHEDEYSLLNHFLVSVDICKENRNVIVHASYSPQQSSELMQLTKGRTPDHSAVKLIPLSIPAIREIADATFNTATFGFNLWASIQLRRSQPLIGGAAFSLPLPKKPVLPRKWDRILAAPTLDPTQPRSSRE